MSPPTTSTSSPGIPFTGRALLDGIRVVELANDRCANGAKLLGDLGADVIVVEAPGGHKTRSYGPFVNDEPDSDNCLWWWNYNTSKRSVVLDLETEEGRESFRQARPQLPTSCWKAKTPACLTRWASITPRSARSARAHWVSVTPNGRHAPTCHEPATDLTILAGGGLVWNCGYDDHSLPPIRPSGGHSHHTASSFATLGALTAVVHRECTGVGQHVDVSMIAATNVTTEVSSIDWLLPGRDAAAPDRPPRQRALLRWASRSTAWRRLLAARRSGSTSRAITRPSWSGSASWVSRMSFLNSFSSRWVSIAVEYR